VCSSDLVHVWIKEAQVSSSTLKKKPKASATQQRKKADALRSRFADACARETCVSVLSRWFVVPLSRLAMAGGSRAADATSLNARGDDLTSTDQTGAYEPKAAR